MIRRLPPVATVLVLIAVGTMIALGIWQLDRRAQKEAMLAQFDQTQSISAEVVLPPDRAAREAVWFRHTTLQCKGAGQTRPMAGHNLAGQTGWAQWADCTGPDGSIVAEVNLGWSQAPRAVPFVGGTVQGVIAPDGPRGARVVATSPLSGLAASALPDPKAIPNNHLSYAVQWFLFAGVALIIYTLAVRKRLAAPGGEG